MSNSIFKFESLRTIILENLKILNTHNFFSKYETAIAFGLLALQYLFIAMFSDSQNSDVEKNYIFFFFEFGFNSVYFNTFIALFLANRILFFNLDSNEKTTFVKAKAYRFFCVFPVIFVVTVTESLLDNIGVLHHEKVGDGLLMSTAGKVFLFVGYYTIIAYLEYRKVKLSSF